MNQAQMAALPDLCPTCPLRQFTTTPPDAPPGHVVFLWRPIPYCQRTGRKRPTAKLCSDHAPPLTRAQKDRIAEQVRAMYAEGDE